jgi:hypothetical protein
MGQAAVDAAPQSKGTGMEKIVGQSIHGWAPQADDQVTVKRKLEFKATNHGFGSTDYMRVDASAMPGRIVSSWKHPREGVVHRVALQLMPGIEITMHDVKRNELTLVRTHDGRTPSQVKREHEASLASA